MQKNNDSDHFERSMSDAKYNIESLSGLTESNVGSRLNSHGYNELASGPGFLSQPTTN